MEKINEKEKLGITFKTYKEENGIDAAKIVNQIIDNNIKIEQIYVFEDCDMGMQSLDSCYDIRKFSEQYDRIMSYDLDSIKIRMSYNDLPINLSLSFKNKLLVLTTPQKDVELDDLIKKNDLVDESNKSMH